MRLFVITSLAVLLSACGGSSSMSDGMPACPNGARVVTVGPGSYGGGLLFSPSTLTISAGETVCWLWANGGHSVTSGSTCGTASGAFCSPSDTNCGAGALSPAGTVYTHTFATKGTFPYFCWSHCAMGMTGTITVQ